MFGAFGRIRGGGTIWILRRNLAIYRLARTGGRSNGCVVYDTHSVRFSRGVKGRRYIRLLGCRSLQSTLNFIVHQERHFISTQVASVYKPEKQLQLVPHLFPKPIDLAQSPTTMVSEAKTSDARLKNDYGADYWVRSKEAKPRVSSTLLYPQCLVSQCKSTY